MSARDWFRVVWKEARALGPAWTVCAVAMLGCKSTNSLLLGVALATYLIGPVTLGALSLGHEYINGTLALLLTHPVTRGRLLAAKLVALAACLISFQGVAWILLVNLSSPLGESMFWAPIALGLFVAPLLTMATRGPIGSAVLTLVPTAILLVVSEIIGVRRYGYTRDVDVFRTAILTWGLVVQSVAGAILTWWTFGRLQVRGSEAASDTGRTVSPARSAVTVTIQRKNRTWLLVRNEFRLQQLTMTLAAVYVAGYMATALLAPSRTTISLDADVAQIAGILTFLYSFFLAALTGAVASAEERQLGTHESQLLLPVSARRQWAVKAGVALGLTFVLAFLLPLALMRVLPLGSLTSRAPGILPLTATFLPIALLVCTTSLYISTLSKSGLWALLATIPAFIATANFVFAMTDVVWRSMFRAGMRVAGRVAYNRAAFHTGVNLVGIGGAILLVWYLALENHRRADRSMTRVLLHLVILAAFITFQIAVWGFSRFDLP
jgi:hypothetical protein